jgi:hypothetical protein
LPVELISFTAQVLNETVKLNWVTASELNNDFFTVQRSADGVEYESLAWKLMVPVPPHLHPNMSLLM